MKIKTISLQKFVLLVSAGAGLTLSAILLLSLAFQARQLILTQFEGTSRSQLNLVVGNISQEILMGSYSEIFRRCNALTSGPPIKGIKVVLENGTTLCDHSTDKNLTWFTQPVFFDENKERAAASVSLGFQPVTISELVKSSLTWGLSWALAAFILLIFFNYSLFLITLRDLRDLLRGMSKLDPVTEQGLRELSSSRGVFEIREAHDLIGQFRNLAGTILDQQSKLSEHKILSARQDLARQVAHDIRSPLSALNLVSSALRDIPEDKRIMIRNAASRINDIANDLLQKKCGPQRSVQLLTSLVDEIVSEKRLQYRDDTGLEIEYSQDAAAYPCFADVPPVEFKRIVSNLINNAAEALSGRKGRVRLSLRNEDANVVLEVTDNGKGIPPVILAQLGEQGKSFGKGLSGSGLGLFHAKGMLADWGGSLAIQSAVGHGTTVQVRLKAAPPPHWFVPRIVAKEFEKIIVVDDDPSIHSIWSQRLENRLEVLHFSNLDDLGKWCAEQMSLEKFLLLIDFEFKLSNKSGLDFLETARPSTRTILVTSHFQDQEVLSRVGALGIGLIPKNMAGIVPI